MGVPPLIIPIDSQIVPQKLIVSSFHKKRQFVPHMLYLFSECKNVIRVQSSDRNMDESLFRTIYAGINVKMKGVYGQRCGI